MRDALGPGTVLGYGTNVHPGVTLAEVKQQLDTHTLAVKRRVCPDGPMGVGLWLASPAMQQLVASDGVGRFGDWLGERDLLPYTLNGFPFEAFHEPVVKDAVYRPHWADEDRFQYTLGLASILAELLPEGAEGSISTLPVGWPASFCSSSEAYEERARAAAEQLLRLVHALARIELDTGRHIHVDLEPEPGCVLETADGVVRFFERYLLGGPDDLSVLSYLRVCHDVCHAAVMFEDQAEALATYRAAGLRVGKVQLSSALDIDFDAIPSGGRGEAWAQLRGFAEPRYLHQTSVRGGDRRVQSYVDLPDAIDDVGEPRGHWRVHFHVPVHLGNLGAVGTARGEIGRFIAAVEPGDGVKHYEVETYAWGVLPQPLRPDELSAGIADELRWVVDEFGP
ncbi:MAG: metabolite traffic protein EboE [Planctomycetota bacterium]